MLSYITAMISSAINRLKSNRSLLIVLLIALAVRIIYLCYYRSLPDWELLTVDNYYHHHWAQSIADGNLFGDTTYFRAPFYIYCLSFLYFVFGISLWVGRIFGVIIGLGSILFTYLIAKKIFNHRLALVAALIHSLYPVAIYFEFELLLDPLFMLLLQISVYNFLLWLDSDKHHYSIWTGIFLGLASITRPTALIILPVIVLIIFYKKRKKPGLYLQYGFFFIPVIIIIGSMTLRNVIVAGDPVLIASQGGINFYIGNNEEADGLSAAMPEPMGHNWQIAEITHQAENKTGKHLKPGEVSSYWLSKGLNWILERPGDFASLYLKKLYYPRKVAPVTIQKGAWIAVRCTILDGVTIGQNSVIAACSLVTQDVDSYCVAGGVPAKLIKKLD